MFFTCISSQNIDLFYMQHIKNKKIKKYTLKWLFWIEKDYFLRNK